MFFLLFNLDLVLRVWSLESGTLTVWDPGCAAEVCSLQFLILVSDAADSVVRSQILPSHWSVLSHTGFLLVAAVRGTLQSSMSESADGLVCYYLYQKHQP